MSDRLSSEKLAEIRARHAARIPGPHMWYGHGGRLNKNITFHLATVNRGLITVMDFVRHSSRSVMPRFQTRGVMRDAVGMVDYEVTYRDDFYHIEHPDAIGLAKSWQDVDALLIERDRLAASVCNLMHCSRMEEHDQGHHAAECPLNVGYEPTWVRVRCTL